MKKYKELQMIVVYFENDICTVSTQYVDGDDAFRFPWENGWSGNAEE